MIVDKSDYYVYLHRRKDNGRVFYVGKGRNNRAKQNSNRSPHWNNIAMQAGGYIVEFYTKFLTEDEALTLEANLIDNPKDDWELVNKISKVNFVIPDITYLRENLRYDPESPSGLTWINATSNRARSGGHAGHLSNMTNRGIKEWQVGLGGKLFKAHRLIMYLVHGYFDPRLVVNHINGDPTNNLLSNLELCTKAENANRQLCHTSDKVKISNKSGINGLYISTRKSVVFSVVDIKINNKRYCRYFSHKIHGYEKAQSLAQDYLAEVNKQRNT